MISRLSVFLPVYNEKDNIERLVVSCEKFLKKNLKAFEIIVVNDGSTDGTSEILERLKNRIGGFRIVNHKKNRGYGAAIKSGIKAARYPWVFFMDSDNQFSVGDLRRFLKIRNKDLIIGYRIKRNDPARRIFVSRVYNKIVDWMFGLNVRDVDCAFKVFRRNSIKKMKIKSNSFFVSTEIICRAFFHKCRIHEIGVRHYPRSRGKSTVTLARVLESLRDLFSLRRELVSFER